MSWLLHNYWMPTVNPTSMIQSTIKPLRPLEPILKEYKLLMKLTSRDVSLRPQYKQNLNTILRSIERWTAEAKIQASAFAGEPGWDTGDQTAKERWALDRLCDALLAKGSLVPLSKKFSPISLFYSGCSYVFAFRKRVFPSDSFEPPTFSIQIWTPLLEHVQSLHPEFASVLVNRIILTLSAESDTDYDVSFNLCLARWAMWITVNLGDDAANLDSSQRREAVIALISNISPSRSDSPWVHTMSMQLGFEFICQEPPAS
jgi:ribosomal biogenesis protein LAS1